MLVELLYQLNKTVRATSDLLVGNYYEPDRDIILVTGGSQGLGKELVQMFSERHTKVVVLDINEPDQKLDNVYYYQCDVSKREEVCEIYQVIKQEIGVVTILINNAGITSGKNLVDLTFDEIEQIFQINLLSSFYTIKTFLPDMLTIKRGYIITIGSVLGYMSPARLSAYGASKAGLIALHESLTYELGSPSFNLTGVKTLLLCPGQLKTGMFNNVRTPSTIFAPELEPKYVASKLLTAMDLGRRGEIKLPMYGNFLPIFRAFPWRMVEVMRNVSGIDKSMDTFKNTAKSLTKRASSLIPLTTNSSKSLRYPESPTSDLSLVT